MNSAFAEFFADLVELEVGEFDESTLLEDIEMWDSMSVISLIAFASNEVGLELTGEAILSCNSVGDLNALIS